MRTPDEDCTDTPAPSFPEMTFRAPVWEPPMRTPPLEMSTSTPSPRFAIGVVPSSLNPIVLRSITAPSPLWTKMPCPPLPEMTLLEPMAALPIVGTPVASKMEMPLPTLGTAAAPAAFVPIRFPRTSFPARGRPVRKHADVVAFYDRRRAVEDDPCAGEVRDREATDRAAVQPARHGETVGV